MGCMRFVYKWLRFWTLILTILFTYLAFAPNQLDIEPVDYKIELFDKFEGPLAPNRLLDNAQILFENVLIGPESFAMHKGAIYTGLHTGEIVKITNDKKFTKVAQIGKVCEGQWEPEVCGRPLGIRIKKNGQLYTADAYYGVYSIDLQSGVKKVLLPITQPVEGEPMTFPDDLDVDDNGVVYLSDASTKWPLNELTYLCMEFDNTGRIIKFDPKSGKSSVIMKGLHFPNGVQISHDGKFLLVAELLKERILKYHLQGAKKGQTEVFVNLPGEPDNIRPSPRGGYWVGMVNARNSSFKSLADYTSNIPITRKIVARLFYGAGTFLKYLETFYPNPSLKDAAYRLQKAWLLLNFTQMNGMALELDKDGNIIRTLQSEDKKFKLISEVLEHEGHLYLGSFINPYLSKVKL